MIGAEPLTDEESIDNVPTEDDSAMFKDSPIVDELHFDAEILVDEEPKAPELQRRLRTTIGLLTVSVLDG